MPPPIETVSRQRYTNPDTAGGECAPRGQDVERDFATYHDALARVHRAALHEPGIAAGFLASAFINDHTVPVGFVHISPGVAVTASGQLIVLADTGPATIGGTDVPTNLPVAVQMPFDDGEYLLTAEPALLPVDGERCGRLAVATRLRLIPASEAPPVPPTEAVLIAVVHVHAGAVFGMDESSTKVEWAVVRRVGERAVRAQVQSLATKVSNLQTGLGILSKTVTQLQGQVTALEARLAAHAGNHDNPHATTASQVGALSLSGGHLSGDLLLEGRSPRIDIRSSDSIGETVSIVATEGATSGGEIILSSNDQNIKRIITFR